MNIVRIMGGLGNQMFQYAFGRMMQENGLNVWYDLSWYKAIDEDRPFLLDSFNVNMLKKGESLLQKTIRETSYNPTLLVTPNHNFSGYWQYLDYYRNHLTIFQKEFTLKKEYYTSEFLVNLEEIQETKSLGIHVRRGDYLGKDFQVMPLSYYVKGIRHLMDEVENVYIFSDDPLWCRKNIKNAKIIHLNPYLDFELLKHCKHQIISSSTFSWWAAWLNDNPGKKVICPKEFIVRREDKDNYNNQIHYPDDWIKF